MLRPMVTEKTITSAITGPVAAGELAGAAALVWADLPQMARGVGLGAWSAIGSFHSVATA